MSTIYSRIQSTTPDNKVDKVEDVFAEYGIDIDGKSDYNARLAQIFLSNMSRSESYTDEFNKIMKNLFEIGFTLRVRLNKSEIDFEHYSISYSLLDACHMRNTINSMSERGIKDFGLFTTVLVLTVMSNS